MADRTVRTKFEAVVGQYQAAMAQMGASTKGVAKEIDSVAASSKGTFKSIGMDLAGIGSSGAGAAAAVAVVGAATLKFTRDAINAYVGLATEVRAYQRVTGESAEQSSLMIGRAEALGISTDGLGTAMFRASRNILINRQELEAHGVTIAKTHDGQIDLGKTLDSVSAAYKRAGAGADGDRLAQLALGRGSMQLLPLLGATAERLKEIDDATKRHGLMLSQQDLDRARQYTIAVHEMSDSWKGFEVLLGRDVVPQVTDLLKLLEQVSHTAIPVIAPSADARRPGPSVKDRIEQIVGAAIHGPAELDKTIVEAFGSHTHENAKAAKEFSDNLDAISIASGVAKPRVEELAYAMNIDLATATVQQKQQLQDAAVKLNAAVTPSERLATVTDILGNSFSTTSEKVNAYKTAVDSILGSQLSAESATITLHQSLQTLADELATGQHVGETVGQYQDRLGSDLVTVVHNVDAARQAMVANGEIAANDVGAQQAFMVQALRQVEDQYPVLRSEIDLYIAKLGQIPMAVRTIAEFVDAQGNPLTDQSFEAWALAQSDVKAGGQLGATTVGGKATGVDNTKANGTNAASGYLDAIWQARMQGVENRFHAGQATLAQYQASLDEQMAHEVPWTNAWVALQQKKADAAHYWTDATKTYLDAIASHQRELEDNEYTMGAKSKDEYLALLEERLKGLEKYSNAWTQIAQQIQQIEGAALDAQMKIIQAYDQGRAFQEAFDAAAGQRQMSASWQQGLTAPMSPAAPGIDYGRLASSLQRGTTYNPQFNVSTADPLRAATTANQQLRDYAALVGV